MKRTLFVLCLILTSINCMGQINKPFDISKFELVDSLPIERVMMHFKEEVDDSTYISLGDGDYMIPVPHKDNMIIKTTADKTKAIVIHNSYAFGRRFIEFNIKENERRIELWFESKRLYCGYIYDKQYKVCKYFESRKEHMRFIKKPPFVLNTKM